MSLFGGRKRHSSQRVVSSEQALRHPLESTARAAIKRGRYRIYGSDENRATLLVVGTPSLIVTVFRYPADDGPQETLSIQTIETTYLTGFDLHEQLDPLWG
ncbi:hypothetical protein NDN01_11185 [Sphingomonas sp. QA11]|uniref:hypothetical protein n=1 Tax=Sphingomonas sp. QA11 TaxID=2950605 RepID=UPI002349A5FD|nr:hypothetical protein [Sphingomonas sp. QA11]WCM29403.1 hypothetical protein NDN01_11185 [Sphingomonas sp. QA11]